jgi:hypothetical protein
MLRFLGLLTFATWQEQVAWDPIDTDHRPEMIGMFVFGAAIVAVIVVARRLLRREKPANRKILE